MKTSRLYRRNQARLARQWQWQNKQEAGRRSRKRKAKREEWISELVFLALVALGVIVLLNL